MTKLQDSREGDREVKSLSEAPEHGEGLGREGPGRHRAVRTLVTTRWALAAEPPS